MSVSQLVSFILLTEQLTQLANCSYELSKRLVNL